MTNRDVRDGFDEAYNGFWNKYKNRVPEKSSQEWERMNAHAVALMGRHPFMREAIAAMVVELDQRMRSKGG